MNYLAAFTSELEKIAEIGMRSASGSGEVVKPPAPKAEAKPTPRPAKEPKTNRVYTPKKPGPYGYLSNYEVQKILSDRRKAAQGLSQIDTSKPGARPVAIMSPGGPGPDRRTGYRPPPAVLARRAREAAARSQPQQKPPAPAEDGPPPDVKMTRFNETTTQRRNRLKMQQEDPDRWNRLKGEHRARTSPIVKATEQMSGKGQAFAPDPEGRFATPQPKPNVGAPAVPSVVARPAPRPAPVERVAKKEPVKPKGRPVPSKFRSAQEARSFYGINSWGSNRDNTWYAKLYSQMAASTSPQEAADRVRRLMSKSGIDPNLLSTGARG